MQKLEALQTPTVLPHPSAIDPTFGELGYTHEMWELQYHSFRYLIELTNDQIHDRHEHLIRNMRSLVAPDRHVIPIESFRSSWFWFRKEHQTRMEFMLRGLEPTRHVSEQLDTDCPTETWGGGDTANHDNTLYRYDSENTIEIWLAGNMRLRAAWSNEEPSLGAARADKENQKDRFTAGKHTQIAPPDGRTYSPDSPVRRSKFSDYYFLCVSREWDPELIRDFDGSEACLIIRNATIFAERLETATQQQLPGWNLNHLPIEYYDPWERVERQFFAAKWSKDFKYAYQQEYRFVWTSENDDSNAQFKKLAIGTLTDIAKVRRV